MIGVGINNNVVLVGAEVHGEKGYLMITFDKLETLLATKSLFEAMNTGEVEAGKTSNTLNVFTFKVPSGPKNENKSKEELLKMVNDDVLKVKSQLAQILQLYMLEKDIKWDAFQKTPITKDNWADHIMNDDVLKQIFSNYANQFVDMVSPFLKQTDMPLRLKLVRQSKEKHFPSIPSRFLTEQPFVELMAVPTPRVKFSAYEIREGLDNPDPIAKPAADAQEEAPAENAPSAFGNR